MAPPSSFTLPACRPCNLIFTSLGGEFYNKSTCFGEAKYTIANMPPQVEQIFSEIGGEIGTGGAPLIECSGESNPCHDAYQTYFHAVGMRRQWVDQQWGRPSWDPVVVLAAVRGAASINAVQAGRGGFNLVNPNGGNEWQPEDSAHPSSQSYLVLEGDSAFWDMKNNPTLVAQQANFHLKLELDRLLCRQPGSSPV